MYLSIFKPSQTPKYSAIWWMFLCYESAGFLSWNLFFCVFEICRAAFYRNTPQAELAFIRKGKKSGRCWVKSQTILSSTSHLITPETDQSCEVTVLLMLIWEIFTRELPHCHCFYRYEIDERLRSQYLSKLWSLEEICPGRAQLRAQLSDGVMEAEEGSIRWGENLRLAGRKNVSICASEP